MERSESREIWRLRGKDVASAHDDVTAEEPMEIRVEGRSVAVVMRTPGDDLDLVRGFLLTEGIIKSPADVFEMSQCPSQNADDQPGNRVDVILARPDTVDLDALSRHVFASSSCGLCGRATIESVFQQFPPVESGLEVTPKLVASLPEKLRAAQAVFSKTGGLHASALFTETGDLVVMREDVGRHNALDKVIGAQWRAGEWPLSEKLLLVSGRISFELMQKALCAGIPLVAGISAPSTLAIDCAVAGKQCLVGFLRGDSMNVYAHPWRLGLVDIDS